MRRVLVVGELHQVFCYQLGYEIKELVVLGTFNEVLERMCASAIGSHLKEQRKWFFQGFHTDIFVLALKGF
jgi:hypothetical protein